MYASRWITSHLQCATCCAYRLSIGFMDPLLIETIVALHTYTVSRNNQIYHKEKQTHRIGHQYYEKIKEQRISLWWLINSHVTSI